MSILGSLGRNQREAMGLLQIGTFLEYFDLYLFVHMAVLLNELFFPAADPHTAALVTAFAFCSTYVLRPFGALLFGWIGDNIGRKSTVIITTMMMSISCIIMANLPTYAEVGIVATWIVTVCRIVQGLSSMGEIIGAQVYISEITKPPVGYAAVSFINVASGVGGMGALGIAALTTLHGFNWRIAFWIGACIAVIGSIARTRLRETPEFLQKKNSPRRLQERTPYSTLLGFFFVQCGWPLCFYLAYFYFNPILKQRFGYSPQDIIFHNFVLTAFLVLRGIILATMSYYINPLRILKFNAYVSLTLMILLPVWASMSTSLSYIFLLQVLILIFGLNEFPAQYIFIKSLAIHRRFTASSLIYASSRALTYICTSFGVVYLTEFFGHWGLLIITIPLCLFFLMSIRHFEKLEGLRPDKSLRNKDDVLHSQAA